MLWKAHIRVFGVCRSAICPRPLSAGKGEGDGEGESEGEGEGEGAGAGAEAGKGEGEGEGDEEVQRVGRHHVSTPHSGPDARSDCTHTTVQQHERTMAGTF